MSQLSEGTGGNNVQGVQGNVTIVQNFGASKPAAGPPTSPAGSAPRPWVAIEGLDASKPLTFEPGGSASAQVQFSLRNNGDAPAADVDVRGSLFAISLMGLTREQMKDTEAAYCDRFRTQQDQAVKFSLYAGRPVAQTLDVGLNQVYLDEAINKSEHGLFTTIGKGVIPVALILCVDYRSPSAQEHHQSQYAMQFVVPGNRVGNSNSYRSFLIGFEPKGSHPDAHLISMDQTID